jgi:hypothetical protein
MRKARRPGSNVQHGFHGTASENVLAICRDGFSRDFAAKSNGSVCGKGANFAVKASYSSCVHEAQRRT